MTPSTGKLLVEVDQGIAWLSLNQPARRNAISREMWQGLVDAAQWLRHSDAVRVVVLRGAGGKAFAAGADISEFDAHNANAAQSEAYAALAEQGMASLRELGKPLIAMIEGPCIGAGLGLALCADLRFAAPSARFAIPAARLGLSYGYEGIAALARLVGPSVARDILFSARHLDAAEALACGLVNAVETEEALLDRTRAYALRVAANAPLTVRASKAALDLFERTSQGAATAEVQALIAQCYDSADYAEGRKAFAEKRAPVFVGR